MRIHYVQHVPFENPGYILTWARKRGWELSSTHLYNYPAGGAPFPQSRDFDWLVIMGGPMNVYEEVEYPWLSEEKVFIKNAVDNGKTVIGLCLGAQLLACVLGGKVTRNPHKEIGWLQVSLSLEARSSPLFSFLPEKPLVFQWHGDTFSALPSEAVLLAESEACKNQAFMYRERVFAFQFHLENTREIIQALVDKCGDDLDGGRYVQTREELLSHPEYIAQDNLWMDEFLSRLEKLVYK
ncbi:MAG: type 1 glutamine amidotransferase [Treponema sp.]|jgi:GMP synthase-like glutamine amidotransferase|nr:type 1 glutamine amidotransferase [Treponema sp.]